MTEPAKDNIVFLQTSKTEGTGRGQYSVDKVFPGASNNRTQIRVALSDEWIEAMSAAIAGGKLPVELDTPHKIVRDAVVHRMKYWRDHLPPDEAKKIDRALSVEIAERDDRQYENTVQLIEKRRKQLERAWMKRDAEYLEEILEKCQIALEGIEIRHLYDDMYEVVKDYERKLETLLS